MGLGGVHLIDMLAHKRRPVSRASMGAEKWLHVQAWHGTAECFSFLRAQGRQIIVTHLDDDAIPITEVDWTKPTALVLGNEVNGVSEEAVQLADATCVIPMAGFVQSFNISVAAAIILHTARDRRIQQLGKHASLSPDEVEILTAVMLLRGTKEGPAYLRRFVESGMSAEALSASSGLQSS